MTERNGGSRVDPNQPVLSQEHRLLHAQDSGRRTGPIRAPVPRLAEPKATPKVLIADDERSLRMLVAATLASQDYTILEATTGEQALAIVRTERPQLVLLDVSMPDISGLEVCRQIKDDLELCGTRVVMLTGATSPEDFVAGAAAGADLYLTKPFRPLELLQVIERAMR